MKPNFHYRLLMIAAIVLLLSASLGAVVPGVGTQPAFADTSVTLSPVADTYVYEGMPTTNYGSSSNLNVARSEFLQESFALLRFDLTSIPSNAVISSASVAHHHAGRNRQRWHDRQRQRAHICGLSSGLAARPAIDHGAGCQFGLVVKRPASSSVS